MNIVIISTSDIGHGAGIAAYRLHKGLRETGINSSMMVSEKMSDDNLVFPAKKEPSSRVGQFFRNIDHQIEYVLNLIGPQNIYSVASRGIENNKLIQQADIIHMHNIHWLSGNFSLLQLFLAKKKPVIWTIHDMWPMTGHCFYSLDCQRWRTGCGHCPDLKIFVPIKYDSSAFQWKIKRAIYKKTQPLVVTPSKWLAEIISEAPVFRGCEVVNIPNGIDQEKFKPIDQKEARGYFDLETDKKIVLFVSSELRHARKGYEYFEKAILSIREKNSDILIMTVGKGSLPSVLKEKFNTKELGYIESPEKMAKVYSSADIYVMPSLQDNLPNVAIESLACGTPVVCFDTGGVPEIVEHLKNGYVAKHKDVKDLAKGMNKLLNDRGLRKEMKINAIKTVGEKFSESLQVKRHIDLYERVLKTRI
ncbi:MAG: glycosyltransferase family 4 protein [Candidatus Omnitrophota bacterium]